MDKIQPENYVLLDKYQSPKSLCENNDSFYESFDIFLIEEISKNSGFMYLKCHQPGTHC